MADDKDLNRDPLTGAPGSHPVGTGLGAAGGGAAGAAIGTTVGGPIGAVVGAAAGAVVGGLAGKGAAEAVNPTAEDAFWRDNYMTRPYFVSGESYDIYQPAYQYGWESYSLYPGRTFDDVETDLRAGWEKTKYSSSLAWNRAKHAARDAWHRVERALPGDFDKDGR
jgi:hypothetical protein